MNLTRFVAVPVFCWDVMSKWIQMIVCNQLWMLCCSRCEHDEQYIILSSYGILACRSWKLGAALHDSLIEEVPAFYWMIYNDLCQLVISKCIYGRRDSVI